MASFRFGSNEAHAPIAAFPAAASSAFSRMMRAIEDRRHAKALETINSRRPQIRDTHGAREARNLTEQFAQARRHRDYERQIENAFIAERLCRIQGRRPILCDSATSNISSSLATTTSHDDSVFQRLSARRPKSAAAASPQPKRSNRSSPSKTPWRPSSATVAAAEAAQASFKGEDSNVSAARSAIHRRSASHSRESARIHRASRSRDSSKNAAYSPRQSLEQARRIREKKIHLENQYIGQRILHAKSHYSKTSFARHEAKHAESLYRFSANPRMGNSLAHSPQASTMQYRREMQKIIDSTWAAVGTPAPAIASAPPGFRREKATPRRVSQPHHGRLEDGIADSSGPVSDLAQRRQLLDEAINAGEALMALKRSGTTPRQFVPELERPSVDEDSDGNDIKAGDSVQSPNSSQRLDSSPVFSSHTRVASIYDVDPGLTTTEIRQRQREQIQRTHSSRNLFQVREGSAASNRPVAGPAASDMYNSPRPATRNTPVKSIDIEEVLYPRSKSKITTNPASSREQDHEGDEDDDNGTDHSENFIPRRFSRPTTYHKQITKGVQKPHKSSTITINATQSQSHSGGSRELWIGPQQDEYKQRHRLPTTTPLESRQDSSQFYGLDADLEQADDDTWTHPNAPLRFPLESDTVGSSTSQSKRGPIRNASFRPPPAFKRVIQ